MMDTEVRIGDWELSSHRLSGLAEDMAEEACSAVAECPEAHSAAVRLEVVHSAAAEPAENSDKAAK